MARIPIPIVVRTPLHRKPGRPHASPVIPSRALDPAFTALNEDQSLSAHRTTTTTRSVYAGLTIARRPQIIYPNSAPMAVGPPPLAPKRLGHSYVRQPYPPAGVRPQPVEEFRAQSPRFDPFALLEAPLVVAGHLPVPSDRVESGLLPQVIAEWLVELDTAPPVPYSRTATLFPSPQRRSAEYRPPLTQALPDRPPSRAPSLRSTHITSKAKG